MRKHSSLLFLLCMSFFCAQLRGAAAGKRNRFEFTQAEMGLPFRIVLYAPDKPAAEAAATAAFARIHQLNNILSDYDSDSELSQLSQTSGQGKAVPVSQDLWVVLVRAQEMAKR